MHGGEACKDREFQSPEKWKMEMVWLCCLLHRAKCSFRYLCLGETPLEMTLRKRNVAYGLCVLLQCFMPLEHNTHVL